MRIIELVSTEAACLATSRSWEFLEALDGTLTFAVEDAKLRVSYGDEGKGLLFGR